MPSDEHKTRTTQRTLSEARANDYDHMADGMTLGTVCEHPKSGAWVLVIDTRDDGRVMVVNLDEVPDGDIVTLEDAYGCYEQAKIGRGIAACHPDAKYIAPPAKFEVLGPVHPDYQRRKA